jgi:hypothetical protein
LSERAWLDIEPDQTFWNTGSLQDLKNAVYKAVKV